MSIAFSAVLIFLMFAPGAILRRSYLSGRFSKKFIYSSAIDEISWAIIPGTLLHLIMLYFTQQFTSYGIDFSSLGFLLIGAKDDANIASAFQVVGRDIWKITSYNLTLWLFAMALGHGFRMLVRSLRLDLKYDLLRFNNEWYYFMSGEIIEKNIDFVWIDALVQTSEGSIIYSGLLQDFYLSKDGGLERIYLTQVARRKLSNETVDKPSESEQEGTPRYYDVPGDLFVIKYSQVVNLNLNYFSTVE